MPSGIFLTMSKSGYLLDSSALIALAASSHDSHTLVIDWMVEEEPTFATCPITQGALLRISMKAGGLSFSDAQTLLFSVVQHPKHRFVPDAIPYGQVARVAVHGHQQVTDAYLAELARSTGLKLATLDRAQAALYSDVAQLLQP
jgi:predicted nucleic acid-binding protein